MGTARNPRVSFSGLARYLTATSIGRRAIVKQSKYPTDGPLKGYVAVDQSIVGHLVDGASLHAKALSRDYESEARGAFETCGWPSDDTLVFDRPSTTQRKLNLAGVDISVFPTVLVNKDGKRGACKLHYAKSAPLDESTGQAMAALLYYYGSELLGDKSYDPALCEVVDVRTGDSYTSTGNYKRLLKMVEAACEEIALRWPSL